MSNPIRKPILNLRSILAEPYSPRHRDKIVEAPNKVARSQKPYSPPRGMHDPDNFADTLRKHMQCVVKDPPSIGSRPPGRPLRLERVRLGATRFEPTRGLPYIYVIVQDPTAPEGQVYLEAYESDVHEVGDGALRADLRGEDQTSDARLVGHIDIRTFRDRVRTAVDPALKRRWWR